MIDSQLMERYVVGRDSAAFRDLVARHGPAVLRVCRRFVHDPHEAEDAMQATFLVLVQRAPSIRNPEQLDSWLAGVARKVAARTRKREARRLEREQEWAETRRTTSDAEKPVGIEARRAVREELGQLPEADRQPLTLCYLDGLTHEEAARRIGCPVGTIKARLVRARRRLRDRLDRRGVALSLGLLIYLLRSPTEAAAADDLTRTTADAMAWLASGDGAAVEACHPHAWALFRAVPVATRWVHRAPILILVLSLAVVVFGSGVVASRSITRRVEARQATARLAKVLDVSCQVHP